MYEQTLYILLTNKNIIDDSLLMYYGNFFQVSVILRIDA